MLFRSRTPTPLVHSPPLTDRQSTFIAHATPTTSGPNALAFQSFVRAYRAPSHPEAADHEILGWRTLGLKVGKTGAGEGGEEDWVVRMGSDDDDEKNAGATVKRVLEEAGAVDVAVVVSRYYGGA